MLAPNLNNPLHGRSNQQHVWNRNSQGANCTNCSATTPTAATEDTVNNHHQTHELLLEQARNSLKPVLAEADDSSQTRSVFAKWQQKEQQQQQQQQPQPQMRSKIKGVAAVVAQFEGNALRANERNSHPSKKNLDHGDDAPPTHRKSNDQFATHLAKFETYNGKTPPNQSRQQYASIAAKNVLVTKTYRQSPSTTVTTTASSSFSSLPPMDAAFDGSTLTRNNSSTNNSYTTTLRPTNAPFYIDDIPAALNNDGFGGKCEEGGVSQENQVPHLIHEWASSEPPSTDSEDENCEYGAQEYIQISLSSGGISVKKMDKSDMVFMTTTTKSTVDTSSYDHDDFHPSMKISSYDEDNNDVDSSDESLIMALSSSRASLAARLAAAAEEEEKAKKTHSSREPLKGAKNFFAFRKNKNKRKATVPIMQAE